MINKTRKNKTMAVITVLLIALLSAGSVLASEGNEIEVEGTVVALDPEGGTIELDVEGEILIVQVAGDFDFETIAVGDLIEVKGTLGEDGVLVLSEYKIQDRVRDRVKTQDGDREASFCSSEDKVHPVAASIAETYGKEYQEVLTWICGEDRVGLGQVMLAMQTAESAGGEFGDYLGDRESGLGWGQIWQESGTKGKPEHGTPPGQLKKESGGEDGEGKIPPGQSKKDQKKLECTEELEQLGICELQKKGGKGRGKNK